MGRLEARQEGFQVVWQPARTVAGPSGSPGSPPGSCQATWKRRTGPQEGPEPGTLVNYGVPGPVRAARWLARRVAGPSGGLPGGLPGCLGGLLEGLPGRLGARQRLLGRPEGPGLGSIVNYGVSGLLGACQEGCRALWRPSGGPPGTPGELLFVPRRGPWTARWPRPSKK